MVNESQIEWVKKELKTNGSVTRNRALSLHITRLAAIIKDLKEEGWEITGRWLKTPNGKDYKYILGEEVKAPRVEPEKCEHGLPKFVECPYCKKS